VNSRSRPLPDRIFEPEARSIAVTEMLRETALVVAEPWSPCDLLSEHEDLVRTGPHDDPARRFRGLSELP